MKKFIGFLDFLANNNILSKVTLEFVLEGKYDIAEVGQSFMAEVLMTCKPSFFKKEQKNSKLSIN